MKLETAIENWLKIKEGEKVSSNTLKTYRAYLNKFSFHCTEKNISDIEKITESELVSFLSGYKDTSVSIIAIVIKSFLGFHDIKRRRKTQLSIQKQRNIDDINSLLATKGIQLINISCLLD